MNVTKNNPNTGKIGKDAQGANKSVKSFAELSAHVDKLENDFENFQNILTLEEALKDYVKYLKKEVTEIRIYRICITALAIIFSVALFCGFCYYSLFPPCWFAKLGGNIKVPFLITLSAMSVLLLSLCLRGVYQTRKDRNYDDYLPESLNIATKAMGNNT